MAENIYTQLPHLKSRISFQPLLRLWKKIIDSDNSAAAKICHDLYQQFHNIPELLQPITDYTVLEQHKALVEEAMTTIFPASFSERKELFAVAMPFHSKSIYASSFFKLTYLDAQGNYLFPLDPQVAENVSAAKIHLAYKLILKKWYDIELIGGNAFLCSYPEHKRNIHNYFELQWDPEFIDVFANFDLPLLPEHFLNACHHIRDLARYPELSNILPLENFVFDGFVITRIREVSERETINNIRSIVQQENTFEDAILLRELKQQLRYLLGLEEADIGFTAFYDDSKEIELATINYASILLKNISVAGDLIKLCQNVSEELDKNPDHFWWIKNADPDSKIGTQLRKDGWQSALVTALHYKQKIIGCLEVVTKSGEPVNKSILMPLQYVKELLETGLQHYRQQLQNNVSQLVKEHFTAVQSSVEWKFNNAAIHYLRHQYSGNSEKMESVIFKDVYPFYGAVDIRNSSHERNRAVQDDMLQQLRWVKKILKIVEQTYSYPLLQESQSQVHKHIDSISNFLFAADEQVIQHFLRTEAAELLGYLAIEVPGCRDEIDAYFAKVALNQNLLDDQRSKFEKSVTEINNTIAKHLEQEQEKIQSLYPHYFERFVTDGVEFNMYIGQSIAPDVKFDVAQLKNFRLRQLSSLATAAQQVHMLNKNLPLPLETTQLMLVYNEPISIRFRNAERKFDIDGVHHARYEVIKKRIDKAVIKGSRERLTQPGTIAIVYSGGEDAKEYLQHIEYLKSQNLLTGTTEIFELEELQAVSGLKALRVSVQLEHLQKESDPNKSKVKMMK
ncbi:MAG TPA: hypothetical protein VNA26_09045 [Chitinophagaceae bacterium]|nr:hypothetical protein [Chitinophagaceae bacterium]